MYAARYPLDDSIIISSGGNKKIFKIFPDEQRHEIFVDCEKYELKNVGNCIPDKNGNVWINEITGCRLWQFDSEGKKKMILGQGTPGFNSHPVKFSEAKFHWIYDIRMGPDNNLYVLDSRNFTLRMLDFDKNEVINIAGCGSSGYTGDGSLAKEATFGSDVNEQFDGPWAISIDEIGNIYVGDTHNHVVRMIEKSTGKISTILGNPNYIPSKKNSVNETDLEKINLPKICSMDYYNSQLFIPEWDGDLIVIEKIFKNSV